MVIVDTLTNYYRTLVKSKSELANKMLISQIRILKSISKTIPVIITSQVYANLDNNDVNPVGRKIVTGDCSVVIKLDQSKERILRITKPENKEIKFEIKQDDLYFLD